MITRAFRLVPIAVSFLLAAAAFAGEAAPPPPPAEKVTLVGTVKTLTDEWEDPATVTLTVKSEKGEMVYKVTMDRQGVRLSYKNGQTVKVVGTVTMKDKDAWLKVDSIEKAGAAPEKGGAEAEKGAGKAEKAPPKEPAKEEKKAP